MEVPHHLTIGFLRRGYSPSGGVEAYLKGLAGGLAQQGHRVILFGTDDWPAEEWPGGEILRCRGSSLKVYSEEVKQVRQNSGTTFDLILSVEKVPGCDIYRTDEGVHAAWLTQRSRYISTLAGWFQWISPRHRERLRMEKALFQRDATRRVISLSEKISREIMQIYHYPESQITLIRNGVGVPGIPADATRQKARMDLGLSADELCILFVGTGWERKGLLFATQAVEKLAAENPDRKITLLVAGSGKRKRYATPNTRFLGPVKVMHPVYAAADLFLLPTIFDPFPLSALEALGMGIPIITTAANGVSEVITPGVHGEVIQEPSDLVSLASALSRWMHIWDQPVAFAAARVVCADFAAEFTLEKNLQETLVVMEELMAKKSIKPCGNVELG